MEQAGPGYAPPVAIATDLEAAEDWKGMAERVAVLEADPFRRKLGAARGRAG